MILTSLSSWCGCLLIALLSFSLRSSWFLDFLSFFFFFKLWVCLLIDWLIDCCVGSSFLCEGFLQLRQAGTTLHRGARASHYRGLSCCRAQAPEAQAQQLWFTGLVAPRHVGSSQTRAQTRVPCIGRQTLNHCATREAHFFQKKIFIYLFIWQCWVLVAVCGIFSCSMWDL